MENKKREFGIDKANCKIRGKEKDLYGWVGKFLDKNYNPNQQETQQGGYGRIDVHVIDEKDKKCRKIGVEVKPYFTILGAEGAKAFGQALLCKEREDVKKMFVAFPMSDRKEDSKELIENFEENKPRLRRFQKIWEKLGLLQEKGEIGNFSIKDINKHIYNKVYSSLGIGFLGIMGTVKDGKFELEKDPVKEL